jgi:hypothetical protein
LITGGNEMSSPRYAKLQLPVLFLLLTLLLVPISCGAGPGIPSTLSPYLLIGAVAGTLFSTVMAVRGCLRDASSNPSPPPDPDIGDHAAKKLILEHRQRDSDLFPFG